MRKSAMQRLLCEALDAANADIRGQRRDGDIYAGGLSTEGFAGGYAQAINDVSLALNDAPPSNSRYWPNWKHQQRVAGRSRVGRIHFMETNGLQQAHRTACGREGYPERDASEASTASGDRFEITCDPRRVTCQRCAAANGH